MWLTERRINVGMAIVLFVAAVLAWVFTAQGETSFSVVAREFSFDGAVAPPAITDPSAIERVEISDVQSVAGEPKSNIDCVVFPAPPPTEGEPDGGVQSDGGVQPDGGVELDGGVQADAGFQQPDGGVAHAVGMFTLLKPLIPRALDCTNTLKFGLLGSRTELGFRSSGKDCRFSAEIGLSKISVAPDGGYTRTKNELPELQCRPATGATTSSERSVPIGARGWVRAYSSAPSFDVWDNAFDASKLEIVLNQAVTFGFSDRNCSGGAGDRMVVNAARVTVRRVIQETQGITLRFSASPDWSATVGGCNVSARRKRWEDVLVAWFLGFAAVGGAAVFLQILKSVLLGKSTEPEQSDNGSGKQGGV
jgi:hypothetical protein